VSLPPLATSELHHVGIVVADLESAISGYARLGFGAPHRFAIAEQGIEAVTFALAHGYVELIRPTDPEGAIARFLAKRGDGAHHIAYRVADIGAALTALEAEGIELIDRAPRTGAHGWRVAFIHPRSCAGVLTELVQVPDDRARPPREGAHGADHAAD
jgi:methylmalonyl-CoA/ethylmalonyl-CoA epimerase